MCIAVGFHGSRTPIQDWERASGVRRREEPETTNSEHFVGTGWTFKATSSATLAPGKYYIGDLSYALDDDIYHGVFGANDYEMGLYTENNSQLSFLIAETAYGDGVYEGSDGKEFSVDAGIIGICHEDLIEQDGDGGHMYTFQQPIKCNFKGGIFRFESGGLYLRIDTTTETK
jgi:hypothetical protein